MEQDVGGSNPLIHPLGKVGHRAKKRPVKSGKTLLYVSSKLRTIFPKADKPGRKEIEEIMRKSKEWKQAITFDIVKLGMAYDKKKLSESLRKKLKPFTHREEAVRLYTKEIEENEE